MDDKRPQSVTGPKALDHDPTSRHFQKEHVELFSRADSAEWDINSTINATNAELNTTPQVAMPRVKSAPNPPPKFHHRTPQPITPVKADRPEELLEGYPFQSRVYLTRGFHLGFRIYFEGERRIFEPPNLKSATAQPDIIRDKLDKEINAGQIASPFQNPPFPDMFCSPLGIVPKKNPSAFRLIHHLSFPRGSSINDSIPSEVSSVVYATINDAISVLKRTGRVCFMAKTGIKSAFRIIPVHPDHHFLLGMTWKTFTIVIIVCQWAAPLLVPSSKHLAPHWNGSLHIVWGPPAYCISWTIFYLSLTPKKSAS